ncbi:MAG: hypothetical protein J6P45_06570, partial [Lachnospiraceae bacterium]|nr:hypothetical protein [Lachnospiraceae bacterium]
MVKGRIAAVKKITALLLTATMLSQTLYVPVFAFESVSGAGAATSQETDKTPGTEVFYPAEGAAGDNDTAIVSENMNNDTVVSGNEGTGENDGVSGNGAVSENDVVSVSSADVEAEGVSGNSGDTGNAAEPSVSLADEEEAAAGLYVPDEGAIEEGWSYDDDGTWVISAENLDKIWVN